MVQDPIVITTTTVGAAGRAPTYGAIAILGTGAGGSQPDNESKLCASITEVGTYFGTTTNIYKAAALVFAQGIRKVLCIRAAGTTDENLQTALDELVGEDVDFVIYANVFLTSGTYAQHNAVINRCDTNKWLHLIAMSGTVDSMQTNYALVSKSKNVAGIACNTAKDAVAAITGALALKKPWEKMMWMRFAGVDVLSYFSKSDVDTLEGGANPINVVIRKRERDVLSDGFTNVGGDYKYLDITRTQYWLEALIKDKLESLFMTAEVPINETGLAQIESRIVGACQELVDQGGLNSYTIDMPLFADISEEDRANRVLNNVLVNVQLAGHVQTIYIALRIEV